MGINIHLNKKQNAPQRKPFEVFTPFDTRNGFFGVVKEVHSENNTVHVVTDTGRELMNIPVASQQWVTYKKDGKPQLTGERNLPPVGTYVYCVMPNGILYIEVKLLHEVLHILVLAHKVFGFLRRHIFEVFLLLLRGDEHFEPYRSLAQGTVIGFEVAEYPLFYPFLLGLVGD